ERDGLIARRPDPQDGRSSLISLTPEAMEKMPAVRAAIAAVNAEALAGLSEAEAEAFLKGLATVVANLE
ncbi:MarR family winged helix-turn-helix transcriptional regulator, partial [Acinetobacter baumannii]|uniref:MarR family winged helix-turn-helix transcriptional regulator n=1 Tax=Acinetobacter baumannii TaxID=470 RepID=UPI001D18A44D